MHHCKSTPVSAFSPSPLLYSCTFSSVVRPLLLRSLNTFAASMLRRTPER